MAGDDAPTFGFDHVRGDIPIPAVFVSLTTKANNYRVLLGSHDTLQALRSWANYALDQGMVSPIDLGHALSTVPQVEHFVRTLLDELSDTMINRIITQVRKRVDASELERLQKETDEAQDKVEELKDEIKELKYTVEKLTEEVERLRRMI